MEGVKGAGVYLRCKHDGKLHRRNTRNATETVLTECQFANDASLLTTTKTGARMAMREYTQVARHFGLSKTIAKTMVMAAGK